VPAGAVVFVDEAYADSPAVSFIIPSSRLSPNASSAAILEGIRFAGLRIGCLGVAPARWRSRAPAVPCTASTSPPGREILAALEDLDHLNGYLKQVADSKALLYATVRLLSPRLGSVRAKSISFSSGG